MAVIEMFSWWYLHGWTTFIQKIRTIISDVVDFFSMSSLIRTLFKPFRQISAESSSANSSLDFKFQMFIDRLISRAVGFFTRLILLIIGTALILISVIFGLILVIIWPFIPLLPLAGIVLSLAGITL